MHRRINIAILSLAAFAGAPGFAHASAYYVSPSGSDTNAGTLASPFKTVQRAVTVMETSSVKTTYVRAGQYLFNGQSLTLGSADSGIQLLGYPGEAPVLSGGYQVTTWRSESSISGAYSAPLPSGFSSASPTNMQPVVTVNGIWYDCARTPNVVAGDRYRSGFFYVNTPANPSWPPDYGTDNSFTCRSTDINSTNYSSPTYAGVGIWDKLGWQFDPLPISSVSFGSPTTVNLSGGSTFGISNNSRYYLYGAKGSLDAAGEFWMDAANSRLWIIPVGGVNPSGSTVVISPSEGPAVIEINGANSVLISGFQIRDQDGSSRWMNSIGNYAPAKGGVRIDKGDSDTVQNNTISCTATGVDLEGPNGSNGNGATNCTVRGNEIFNTCVGALSMGGSNTLAGNKAIANYIHDTGLIEQGGHAINVAPAPNYVGYNLMVNVPHFAIVCGDAATASNGLVIEYNTILHSSQGDDDTGAIYLKNGGHYNSSAPEVVRYNNIDDTGGVAASSSGTLSYPDYSFGVYMDADATMGQSGTQVYGNVLNHTGSGGAFAHNGHDNNIYNNVFANGNHYQMVMQSENSPATNVVNKNIFYWGTATNPFKVYWNSAGTITTQSTCSNNVFWDYGDANHDYYWSAWTDYYSPTGAYMNTQTYSQWQAVPEDATSTQSDPLFAGSAYSNYFALKSTSPALSLGFTALPMQQMGPQGYGNAATRINCSGSAAWPFIADGYYSGGSWAGYADAINTTAANAAPAAVYQSERYGTSFSYTVPGYAAGSAHTVRLHFCEQYWGISGRGGTPGAGKRKFNVTINGAAALSNFDVYAAAGGADIADVEQFTTLADGSGQIVIAFAGVAGSVDTNAAVNGIEIDPAGQSPAIQVHAGGSAVSPFIADIDYSGGAAYGYADTIDTTAANSAPAAVYQNGRFGTSFSYTIPGLTPGSPHAVRLHFAELTYGIPARGGGGVGSRFFNVSINGAQVMSNVDVYAAAGAADKAAVATLPATANGSGQIVISFAGATGSPDQNAIVSGIEVY